MDPPLCAGVCEILGYEKSSGLGSSLRNAQTTHTGKPPERRDNTPRTSSWMKLGGYSLSFSPWSESSFHMMFNSFPLILFWPLTSWRTSTNQFWPVSKGNPWTGLKMAKLQPTSAGTIARHLDHVPGQKGSILGESTLNTARCCLTCLKLPFFLCSQSIMSWKMGIMIFRTSGCGTSVTPRKGPIIPGIKWILCSPEQQNPTDVSLCLLCSFHRSFPSGATTHDLIFTGSIWEHSKLSPIDFWDTRFSWLFRVHGLNWPSTVKTNFQQAQILSKEFTGRFYKLSENHSEVKEQSSLL